MVTSSCVVGRYAVTSIHYLIVVILHKRNIRNKISYLMPDYLEKNVENSDKLSDCRQIYTDNVLFLGGGTAATIQAALPLLIKYKGVLRLP